MNCNILLPADLPLPSQRILGAAKALSHLEHKSFSAFFLQDYFGKGEKSKSDYLAKIDVQVALQQEAKILSIDFEFLNYYRNHLSLNYQSSFADLLVLSGSQISEEPFPEKFLELIECPTLLYFDSFTIPDEIVFLFDQDKASLAALKSFISLFGDLAKGKRITIITVSPGDDEDINYEKCLVNYVQKEFDDVGIVPMQRYDLEEEVLKMLSKLEAPLLIAGKPAIALIENKMSRLAKYGISVYYSNH
ncbi:MAG: hypothetical protein RIB47_03415 [Cyclobacteriaceae bacterium]